MPLTTNASLYGRGVFTTVAIFGGEPFLWQKHWSRLSSNAQKLGIDLWQYDEKSVAQHLHDELNTEGVLTCRARITLADETPGTIWSSGEKRTKLSIIKAALRPISEHFKLVASPHRINTTSPLAGIKSCNYLEHLMSFEEAKARGFDEAVRLNERGEIASACMANVFWLNGGMLYTPSLKTGCLAGTTREFILENIECEEVEAGEKAIREADEIYLTSAGIGVVQVAEFAGRAMQRQPHKILDIVPKPI